MQSVVETSGYPQLLRVIRYVRNRWRLRRTLRGVAIMFGFGLATFGIAAYAMDYFRYSPWAVQLFRGFSYLALVGLALRYVVRPLMRRVANEQVALYMEEHDPQLREAVSSAIEVGRSAEEATEAGDASPGHLSPALVRRLVEQTVERCESIDYGHGIEKGALKNASVGLFGVAVVGMIAVLLSPAFIRHGLGLLLNPMSSAQAASPYMILVEPGNVGVARGADQLVSARLQGFDSRETEIALKAEGEDSFQRWPMNLDEDEGNYAFMLFNLESGTDYFVEANGVRSDLYRVEVSDLPYVRQIDLEYHFPVYTGLSPRRVEDGGDIAALRGTEVVLTIIPTVKVAGGVLQIEEEEPIPLTETPDPDSQNLTATLSVAKDGFYRIELEAFDGTMQVASPDYVIEVLSDQPPSVTINKPGRDSKVSPIEEVFTEIEGEDDYGLSRLELVYSVNGGEEQTVSLYNGQGKKEMVAGHTFFLEDFDLVPGDFISYYAQAVDVDRVAGPQKAITDIYFIEARPFDQHYRQAQGGGMPGGGDGGDMDGTLSVRQREIVAATFKLIRDRDQYAKKDYDENLTTLALMQGRLKDQVENLLRRMDNRGIPQADGDFAKIGKSLKLAVEEMLPAEEKLAAKDPDAALPPEQRALQHLQRAEAVFRDIQVSFQQGGGGGGGGQMPNAEDLADLFELELDKLRNQYETVQRGQRQSVDNEVDEALQRLQELARRQQQENERMKRQASRLQNQMGGGGSGGQRDLADETEELARKLERLAREQSQPDLNDTARRLEQAANSMRRAGARGDDAALAEGLSALENLKDARRLLDKNRSVRFERDVEDAMQQAERIAERQQRVQSEVEKFGEGGRGDGELLRRIHERKDELAESVASLENQLDRVARESRKEQKDASRKLQEAANSIRDTKLKEKIRYSKGVVQGRSPEYAQSFEDVISEDIQSLRDQLGEAAGAVSEPDQKKVAEAVDQTRELVRNLESLSDRIRERREASRGLRKDRQGQPGDEQQPGQEGESDGNAQQQGQEGREGGQGQSGQESQAGQQGQQGQEGQEGQPGQEGQGGQGQQGQGSRNADGQGGVNSPGFIGGGTPGGPPVQPGTFSTDEIRQLRREFRERVTDAEQLRRELDRQDLDVPDLKEIIKRMEEFERKQIFLDPLGLEQLEADVLEGLKQFEYWLRREMEGVGDEELYLAGSDQVPSDYRKLVEEYFRTLSRGQK